MRISKLFLSIVFLLSVNLLSAQEVKKWNLQDCVDYAFDNNLTVQRSSLSVQNSEALLRQARLGRVPTLNFNIFNSWRGGRSIDPTSNQFVNNSINSNGVSASSQVMLYNGMQQVNTIKQNSKETEASLFDLQKTKNDVALDVVFGYLQIIFNRELLENARQQLNTTTAQMDQIEKRVNAGALPITNLLDIKSQVASNEVEVINAENNVNISVLNLKQYLQIPAEEAFEIETPLFEKDNYDFVDFSVGEVYNKAESIQPEIKAVDLRIQSASIGTRIARGANYPQLGLQAQYNTNYSDQYQLPTGEYITQTTLPSLPFGYLGSDPSQIVYNYPIEQEVPVFGDASITKQWRENRGWSVGFNMAIPVFNGGQTRANIQRSKIQEDVAAINAKETRNVLRQTIETAYYDAQAAAKVYDAAKRQVEALEESFRATEKSYNLGALNYVDYQVASFNLFSAKSNLVRSKFDYIFKLKVLDFYLGNPLTL
ncbi:MAG: TolC family protein [Cyclobacteriaceae bacterium]|nr:TolC family protein [Cyclobacteriaceae bacterium]